MDEYPDDAVSLLVSRVAYDQAIAALKWISTIAIFDDHPVNGLLRERARRTLDNLGELDE